MATRRLMLPSEVEPHVGVFDRFAGWASRMVSRAWFFATCVLLIVLWAPSFFLFSSVDTWQLVVNTLTTIITFLLVALLQNSQQRADQAIQHKLNAVALALTELIAVAAEDEGDIETARRLAAARRELNAAIGLEQHESA